MRFRTTLILALVLALGILGVVYTDKQERNQEEADRESEKILAYSGEQVLGIHLLPAGIRAERDSSGWQLLAPVHTAGDKISLNINAYSLSNGVALFDVTLNDEKDGSGTEISAAELLQLHFGETM